MRARALAAVHVDGRSEHEADGVAFSGNGQQPRGIGLEGLALDRLDAGRQPAVGIGDRDADGLGAEIEADEGAALGPMHDGFDQGKNGSGHAFA